MTITKQNENYTISDLMESGWKMEGNVMFEINGALTLHASISNENNFVADIHYNKPLEGNVHLGINSLDENREDILKYSNTLINWVLEQFKN